jgi:hypothetical protein
VRRHAEWRKKLLAEDFSRMNGWKPILGSVCHFVFTSLVIIDDLDALRRAFAPEEVDSPSIVDPDAILTLPVSTKRLKPVSRNCRHVLQFLGVVQHPKLPPRHRSNVAESAALLALKELLGLLAAEGSYHTGSISRPPLNGEP